MSRCPGQCAGPLSLLSLVVVCAASWVAADEAEFNQRGETIYQNKCAECHGAQGQGVADIHPDPLGGEQVQDLSLEELTELITETMPEDDPEMCVGEDARAVAHFIRSKLVERVKSEHDALPRARLARLTATQLQHSLADLYASQDGDVVEPTAARGLEAEYYDTNRRNRENRKLERIDPVIDFDFGHESPHEGIKAEDFSIRWTGAIKPELSGRHEIIIRSSCAFVCWLGTYDREFINNHVQSSGKTEFRRTVTLTAGHVVPFKIEFYQRKRKTEQPPAKITLSWVPPHQVEQILPANHLLPLRVPPSFALQTKLPADDRSYGYERGIAVDRQWDDATTAAALEFAQIAAQERWPRFRRRHRDDPNENREVLRQFLAELVSTAFRGPLDASLQQRYVDHPVDVTEDDAEAIKRSLLMALKSPRFMYPTLDADRTRSQRAANRLALVLFDSLPADEWLQRLAREGQLETDEQQRRAAERMVADYRALAKTREFLYAWLNLDRIEEITKNEELYPGFDGDLVSDLRGSLDAFLDEIVTSEASDYRQLFQAEWSYTTERMAQFYGEGWRSEDEADHRRWQRTASLPEQRMGVLTHPYLMSGLAYHDTTSPIHRGVFLLRHILGRTLMPPNEAFTPFSPDLHPDLTTRQRVELQTGAANCQVCHVRINGLGFTLENFDAVGRYRQQEGDQPIDTTGTYTTRSDERIDLDGARQLADFLASSPETHQAFVDRAFEHFVKQPTAAYGAETLDRLTRTFVDNGYHIRKLLVEIAMTAVRDDPAFGLTSIQD